MKPDALADWQVQAVQFSGGLGKSADAALLQAMAAPTCEAERVGHDQTPGWSAR